MKTGSFAAVLAVLCAVALGAVLLAQQQPPPERQEIQAARQIGDLTLRIKELERIKAAYPQSGLMTTIERNILDARVGLCETVDAVDALQRPLLSKGSGFDRLDAYYYACDRILSHRNLDRFDKARVTAVIEAYVADYLKASADPGVTGEIPQEERRHIATYSASMFLFEAQADLRDDRVENALDALDRAKRTGAPLGPSFAYYSAEARARQGRTAEALEFYFAAAVENYGDAEVKARALSLKLHGSEAGFDARLEKEWRTLPFHPGKFIPASGWKGKIVLAELFTGSECGPCVAADLGFDGLIESYAPGSVAVLEYHLPIPGPDPLMNPATRKRQDYYGISSTPTPFFDGERKFAGGGAKPRAEAKFKEYRGEVEARVYDAPPVALEASAVRRGGVVTVDCSFDRAVPAAAHNIALVEKEVRYRGSNGIVFHKMVVRDFVSVTPSGRTARAVFDLATAENLAAAHLEAYEKERSFLFKEKKTAMDPSRLAVVFFVQDEGTKKVLNAVYAEVK
jgi:thiol-disulfide isomerase/thioredoxin